MAIAVSSHAAVEKVRIRFGFVIMTNPRDAQGLLSRHVTPPSPQAHFPTGALPHTPISPPAQTALTTALNGATREHTHGAPSRAHLWDRAHRRPSKHVHTSSSSIAILITHRHGVALLTRLVPGARHGATRASVRRCPPPSRARAESGTRRVGHAPSFVRVANVDATPALVLSRAHASAHDGALHSRTSFECAAPPLNGAIFLRCENMNASPDEGGTQRSSEVIRDHQ